MSEHNAEGLVLGMMVMQADGFSTDAMIAMEGDCTSLQESLGFGDYGLILSNPSGSSQDFQICHILDPLADGYTEQFPDWLERSMKGFFLTTWHALEDRLGGVGWVHRSQIMPLTPEEYEGAKALLGNPEWKYSNDDVQFIDLAYRRYNATAGDHEGAETVFCDQCNSTEVIIHGVHTVTKRAAVMRSEENGVMKYFDTNTESASCTLVLHLECAACGFSKEISESEMRNGFHE